MDATNTSSQAEQIKIDTHQTACVKHESSPPYEVRKRPACFFKQLVEFNAGFCFFCGHASFLASWSRMLP
jgi:hypothetical protein